jgi:hypothetical protein
VLAIGLDDTLFGIGLSMAVLVDATFIRATVETMETVR